MDTSVLIIGGGLSGVCAAYQLSKQGIRCRLIEARDTLGGRILSPRTADNSTAEIAPAVDLGPSWFWPDQKAIAALIDEIGLRAAVYEQASQGNSVIEYANGSLTQSQGGASMAGSLRINGGMMHLIRQLAITLPGETVHCNLQAQKVTLSEQGVLTTVANIASMGANNEKHTEQISSQCVVLALPPRILADSINLQPPIETDYQERLKSVSTWMAGEAKLVATYATPFWRDQGLSGDGMSQIGPMVEIHDASPASGGPYALFGFVGVPSSQRENNDAMLKQAAVEQITRMFGAAGSNPIEVYFKDWAHDPLTATAVDRSFPRAHPDSRSVAPTAWDERLIWAGSEMAGPANAYAGYLEGAVAAADQAVQRVIQSGIS